MDKSTIQIATKEIAELFRDDNFTIKGIHNMAKVDSIDLEIPDYGMSSTTTEDAPMATAVEELQRYSIKREQLEEDKKELFLVNGDYTWISKTVEAKQGFIEQDQLPSDYDPRGRMTFSVFGRVQAKDGSASGPYRLRFSPDKRYKRNRDGSIVEPKKYDSMYKAWMDLDALYLKVNDRPAESIDDILQLVEEKRYYLAIGRADFGNYHNGIKEMR